MSVATGHFYSKVRAGHASNELKRWRKLGRMLVGRVLQGIDVRLAEQRAAMESLESEITTGEPTRLIDELKSQARNTGRKPPATAYLIGRQYMRLGRFEEAREWMLKAARQSSKHSDLQEAVNSHLSVCNIQLLAEGDACFAAGDFHGARERYARLTQGLSDREGRQWAIFLRSSCVYCKLGHYEDADQAVLQALKSDEATDEALGLLDLLQRLINAKDHDSQATDLRSQIEAQLASYVAGLMDGLRVHPQDSAAASGN